jgi:hypothetical protein
VRGPRGLVRVGRFLRREAGCIGAWSLGSMPIVAWFVWDMTAVMMLLYQHSYADHDGRGGWFDTYVVMLNMNFRLPS